MTGINEDIDDGTTMAHIPPCASAPGLKQKTSLRQTKCQMAIAAVLIWNLLGFSAAPSNALAGTLVNRDKKVYKYSIFWDDMSAPVKGEIGPSEKVSFADKPATLELVGRKDNIFVKTQETIFIQNGVMRKR